MVKSGRFVREQTGGLGGSQVRVSFERFGMTELNRDADRFQPGIRVLRSSEVENTPRKKRV